LLAFDEVFGPDDTEDSQAAWSVVEELSTMPVSDYDPPQLRSFTEKVDTLLSTLQEANAGG